jgi:hypothetical protein
MTKKCLARLVSIRITLRDKNRNINYIQNTQQPRGRCKFLIDCLLYKINKINLFATKIFIIKIIFARLASVRITLK